MSTRAIMVIASDPVDGSDDAYNDWYDRVHLPDVLTVDGFVAARRFRAVPSVHGELPDQRYLAIYEIETDDIDAVQKALSAAAKTMDMGEWIDRASIRVSTYVQISAASRR